MAMYEVFEHKKIYSGRIFDLYQDKVELEDGKIVNRDVVEHKDASVILPIDPDGNVLFVRQYRHPAKAKILELPAGLLEDGEGPMDCAHRELEEETGYRAGRMKAMVEMYSSVGFCTEKLFLYVATDLLPGQQHLDPDEHVEIERYSMNEVLRMIAKGEIVDAKSITAILLYHSTK